jgi:hypothetical protein
VVPRATATDYAYCRRESLLSLGELAFYRALREAVAGRLEISLKTRLADLFHCPPMLWNAPHGRRIAQKHVDFVLFCPTTSSIRVVIELDDRSHERADRKRRDRFLNETLRGAGIPLLRIRAQAAYDVSALQALLQTTLIPNRIGDRSG